LEVAAISHLVGHIGGHVLRPAFGDVEADDSNGILILPLEHAHNDRFEGLTRAFLDLSNLPTYPLDRLGRYKAALWR
jgi:hypothetical protein